MNYRELDADSIEYIDVAGISELGNGDRMFLEIDEHNIVVFNIAGNYFAIGDLCSHDDGPVGEGELEDLQIICPRHGARFDVSNGKALTLPAIEDIPAYPVRTVDDRIEVGLPLES